MNEHINHHHIILWAEGRGILEKSTKKDQFVKMMEEIGEIAECLSKDHPLALLEAELGDLYVTLILLAKLSGTSAEKCLSVAYEKIRGRTGVMKDGVFIKSEDFVERRVNHG